MSKRPTQNLNAKSNIALECSKGGPNVRTEHANIYFWQKIEPGQCHYGGGRLPLSTQLGNVYNLLHTHNLYTPGIVTWWDEKFGGQPTTAHNQRDGTPQNPIFFKLVILSHNKEVQLSLTNPRDAKAGQKLLQFNVLTTLSLTILVYLHSFSCCCVRNLRYPAKFSENWNL